MSAVYRSFNSYQVHHHLLATLQLLLNEGDTNVFPAHDLLEYEIHSHKNHQIESSVHLDWMIAVLLSHERVYSLRKSHGSCSIIQV